MVSPEVKRSDTVSRRHVRDTTGFIKAHAATERLCKSAFRLQKPGLRLHGARRIGVYGETRGFPC